MQPQLGLSAHSVSQLHAAPPLALSSQYQPLGQMPLPHRLQLPSSQLGPRGWSSARLTEASSSSLAESEPSLASPSPELLS
jgi:hypothetical protein